MSRIYRVLLVDDEPEIVRSLRLVMPWSEYGMTVEGEAASAEEALRLIVETAPDVVISDIRLPGMDGLALLRKSLELQPNLMFVMLSGYSDFSYTRDALRYGAYDYLLKPIDYKELDEALSSIGMQLQWMPPSATAGQQLEVFTRAFIRRAAEHRAMERRQQERGAVRDAVFGSPLEQLRAFVRETATAWGAEAAVPDAAEGEACSIRRAVAYIDRNAHLDLGIEEAAARAGLSGSHFCVLFKKETGCTFLEYLTKRRVERACLLLCDTDLPVHRIASLVGYKDSKYFAQVFKKMLRLTPTAFRIAATGVTASASPAPNDCRLL